MTRYRVNKDRAVSTAAPHPTMDRMFRDSLETPRVPPTTRSGYVIAEYS